jgi:type I restriction enzyme M protein
LTKASVKARIEEIASDKDAGDERKVLKNYFALIEKEADSNKRVKEAVRALDAKVATKYGKLSKDEIKTLVVDDKWMGTLAAVVQSELDRVSQALTGRIKQLAERYAEPMPTIAGRVEELRAKVDAHLKKMGFVWERRNKNQYGLTTNRRRPG